MDILLILFQIILFATMLDVWLIRYNTPGAFRGGDAKTMKEEFEVYGLPAWFRRIIRVLKLSSGAMIFAGIWVPILALLGSVLLVGLMLGAFVMHFKVRDPVYKALPALTFMLMAAAVAILTFTGSNSEAINTLAAN